MTALNLSGFFAATLSKIKTWFDRCFECYIFECIHSDLNNIFSPENVLNSQILTIIESVNHHFWTFCGLRSSECGYFKCTKSEKCPDRLLSSRKPYSCGLTSIWFITKNTSEFQKRHKVNIQCWKQRKTRIIQIKKEIKQWNTANLCLKSINNTLIFSVPFHTRATNCDS